MEGRVMIQNDCNWKGMSWDELKQRLTDDPEYKANIELARRVVNNYEVVVTGAPEYRVCRKLSKRGPLQWLSGHS